GATSDRSPPHRRRFWAYLREQGSSFGGSSTMAAAKQSMDSPHEVRPFKAHGHMDVVTLGDFTIGRGVFEPGWRWSEDVKPIAGTGSAQGPPTGFCLSGRMTIRSDGGEEISIGPGDVIDLEPGHDAWTD